MIFLQQLSLFHVIHDNIQTKFQVLDRVKIRLIDEEIDSETYHYRKYYEPHILNKIGEITNIVISKNSITYEVTIYGEKYYLMEEELISL